MFLTQSSGCLLQIPSLFGSLGSVFGRNTRIIAMFCTGCTPLSSLAIAGYTMHIVFLLFFKVKFVFDYA